MEKKKKNVCHGLTQEFQQFDNLDDLWSFAMQIIGLYKFGNLTKLSGLYQDDLLQEVSHWEVKYIHIEKCLKSYR